MSRPVVVINPNSNQTVTDGLEKSLSYFNQFDIRFSVLHIFLDECKPIP